jgi:hypothetical protein
MPVAVVMFVKEKTAVNTTGIRKNNTIMTAAGAIITSPSVLDVLIESLREGSGRTCRPEGCLGA